MASNRLELKLRVIVSSCAGASPDSHKGHTPASYNHCPHRITTQVYRGAPTRGWGQNRRAKEDITYLGPLRAELGLGFGAEEAGQLRRGARGFRGTLRKAAGGLCRGSGTRGGSRRRVWRRRAERAGGKEGEGREAVRACALLSRAGRRLVSARLASSRLGLGGPLTCGTRTLPRTYVTYPPLHGWGGWRR